MMQKYSLNTANPKTQHLENYSKSSSSIVSRSSMRKLAAVISDINSSRNILLLFILKSEIKSPLDLYTPKVYNKYTKQKLNSFYGVGIYIGSIFLHFYFHSCISTNNIFYSFLLLGIINCFIRKIFYRNFKIV